MKTLLLLLAAVVCTNIVCQKTTNPYPYKNHRPTSAGIRKYVDVNQEQFFQDFRKFVGDSLIEDTWIDCDDLSTYVQHDSLELGCFYAPQEILCTTEELYVDYRLQYVSKYRRSQFVETNQFVYSTVMHEIGHMYWQQVLRSMGRNAVLPEFLQTLRVFPYSYGAEFLEEGLCEYIPYTMQEILSVDDYKPRSTEDIINNRNTYSIKYRYARLFVTPVIQKYGLRKAIEIMVCCAPPSIEEILYPEKYYQRLVEK